MSIPSLRRNWPMGLEVPFNTIEKHIRILLKKGLIEHRGSNKTGGYYPL